MACNKWFQAVLAWPASVPDEPPMIAGRSTRMEVLELLRRKGRCSAETIASDLGVTPNAVRQHLTNLERDGLVVSHPERSGRGRPSLLFSLTERADSVFPKRYGQLATMVLQEVQEMGGPEALDEVFSRKIFYGLPPICQGWPVINGSRLC